MVKYIKTPKELIVYNKDSKSVSFDNKTWEYNNFNPGNFTLNDKVDITEDLVYEPKTTCIYSKKDNKSFSVINSNKLKELYLKNNFNIIQNFSDFVSHLNENAFSFINLIEGLNIESCLDKNYISAIIHEKDIVTYLTADNDYKNPGIILNVLMSYDDEG